MNNYDIILEENEDYFLTKQDLIDILDKNKTPATIEKMLNFFDEDMTKKQNLINYIDEKMKAHPCAYYLKGECEKCYWYEKDPEGIEDPTGRKDEEPTGRCRAPFWDDNPTALSREIEQEGDFYELLAVLKYLYRVLAPEIEALKGGGDDAHSEIHECASV